MSFSKAGRAVGRTVRVAAVALVMVVASASSAAADTTMLLGYEGTAHTELYNNGSFVISPTLDGPGEYSVTGESFTIEHGDVSGYECPVLLSEGELDRPRGDDGLPIGSFTWTELSADGALTLGVGGFTIADTLVPGVYTVRIVCEVDLGPEIIRFDGYTGFSIADPSTTTTGPPPTTTVLPSTGRNETLVWVAAGMVALGLAALIASRRPRPSS